MTSRAANLLERVLGQWALRPPLRLRTTVHVFPPPTPAPPPPFFCAGALEWEAAAPEKWRLTGNFVISQFDVFLWACYGNVGVFDFRTTVCGIKVHLITAGRWSRRPTAHCAIPEQCLFALDSALSALGRLAAGRTLRPSEPSPAQAFPAPRNLGALPPPRVQKIGQCKGHHPDS